MKYIDHEFVRFVFFGAGNSALTYLVYLAGLLVLPYGVSYTVSYILGIALAYWLNVRFVFKARARLGTAIQYPFVYVAQYLIGVIALYLLVERCGMSKWLAPFVVILITVPVTYGVSRVILKGRGLSAGHQE